MSFLAAISVIIRDMEYHLVLLELGFGKKFHMCCIVQFWVGHAVIKKETKFSLVKK